MLEQFGYLVREDQNDPLSEMHDNGEIDDAQLQAGRSYQALYREFLYGLDLGLPTGDLEDELQRIGKSLREPGTSLLYDVVVEGDTLNDVWRKYDEDYDIARWMLDDNLCRLADYYERKPNLTLKRQPPAGRTSLAPQ